MTMEEFLLRPKPEHEAARIANGIAFLDMLKKTAAAASTAVPKQEYSSSTAALNTKTPDLPPYPVSAGQRVGGARVQKPRTPGVKKVAAIQYAPEAARKVVSGFGSGLASDFRGLADSAEGYRAGLSQFTEGKNIKPDLGGFWARQLGRITGKKTPEQIAHAKGPAYYAAFIRAKNAQKGVGAGDLLDELNVSMRNYEGKFTPFSVTRGALGSGLVGQDTLANIGSKSLAHMTGRGDEAMQAAKMKRIAAGVGIGGGGLLAGGMIAKGMQKRDAESK